MIFNLDDIKHIYIAVQYVDFRKAVNGLVAVIEHMFYLPSTDNSLFIFTNKRRTGIKIIYFDTNGYWLFQKTLLNKDKFIWIKDENTNTVTITKEQLLWLLKGMELTPKHQFNPIRVTSLQP